MIENGMVMPTDVNFDRKRQRKVVFYGRVSTEHEAQLAALENQIQWYDDVAAKNPNWYILKKYIDEGITGTQAKKRPAFLQMVQDAKQKKFDLIVTREVCRFARNTVDTLVVTRELKNYGVEVYFVEDNIRTMDGDGELRLTIMATLAQEESRKISERVRAGQKISRDKGVLFGNGNILGYDRDKAKGTYVINPEQAETVRMIYDMYSAGKGMSQIRNELIRLKRKDSSGLVRWENCKIARILHNSTYKGYPAYLKSRRNNFLDQKIIRNRDEDTYLYVKGDFEPIISEEQWDRCRQIREQRVRRNKILTENGEKSHLMATLAQEESRKISERVRAGQKISRDKGVLFGNGNILGYDRDKAKGTYVINHEQAETVRMIYDMYSAGKGMSQIRNELIRLKRKDSSGLVRWENCKIARILHNSTYKGYPAYLKSRRNNFLDQKIIRNRDEDTYLYVKGDFEPIISEEQWDRCRQIREQRIRRNKILTENGEKSHLTGVHTSDDVWTKKLRCRCGYRMRRNKWRKNRNGELIYGYKCYNQLNNGTKTTRQQAGVDDAGFCDLKEICDWKLEMVARRIFSSSKAK